jgi:MFS family permease
MLQQQLETGVRRRLATLLSSSLSYYWVPLAASLLTRLLDVVLIEVVSTHQVSTDQFADNAYIHAHHPADPGFLGVATNWDGQWYQTIAEHGYPGDLPTDDQGVVVQNPWAFLPLYPALVRALMPLTGGSFAVAASLVSVLTSTIAFCWLYRLVREHSGPWLAAGLIVAINAFPAAPTFVTAYSEGLGLLVVVAALDLLRRRRYGWFCVAMLVLGFTRPIAIAFGPVVVLHALIRRRQEGPLPRTTYGGLALAAASSAAGFVLWPLTAALVTGRLDAYPRTQAAWADPGVGWESWLVSSWTLGAAMTFLVGVAVATAAWMLLRPDARRWPVELRLWAASYSAFLLASARPTPSIIRYGMLTLIFCFPFAELGWRSSRRVRALIVAAIAVGAVVMHYVWLDGWFILSEERIVGYP